ncbi:anti-sigma factor antagonist [bacterium]|nr:anti-sigma factor antagonist [bacterium]
MEGIQTTIKYTGPGDSIGVIKVGGYIDTTTSSELERSLSSLLKKNQFRIVVDLGDVDYISSAGWGIFISEIKGIKENNGDLKLVRMIPEVYEVFELLEFHYILKAYDTIDDAVDAFVKESGGSLATAPKAAVPQETVAAVPTPTPNVTPAPSKTTAPKMVQTAEDDEDDDLHAKAEMLKEKEADVDDMTVDEKIEHAISKYPHLGAWQLKKALNTSEYSYTSVGWFEIRKKLKSLKR